MEKSLSHVEKQTKVFSFLCKAAIFSCLFFGGDNIKVGLKDAKLGSNELNKETFNQKNIIKAGSFDSKPNDSVCEVSKIDLLAASLIKEGKYKAAVDILLPEKDSLLRLKNNISCDKELWRVYSYLGQSYLAIEEYDTGFKYYENAYQTANKIGDIRKMLLNLNDIASGYILLKDDKKTLFYLDKAYKLLETIGNDFSEDFSEDFSYVSYLIYNNLSNYYVNKNNFPAAKPFFEKSKNIVNSMPDFDPAAKVVVLSSEVDFLLYEKKYNEAISVYKKALKLAEEIQHLEYQEWLLNAIVSVYEQIGNYKFAYIYQKKIIEVRSQRISSESKASIRDAEVKYRTKAIEAENKTKKAQLKTKQAQLEAQEAKNRVAWGGAAAAILAALGAAGFVRKLNQKNKELQKQKDNMKASITYASGIQKAILSNENCLYGHFPESFVYMSPKDIVSGDFYFTGESPDGKKILVVADCTGHGVPAAFLTILGKTSIQGTIKNVKQPSEILTSLDSFFANQYKTSESAMDSAFADSMTHNDAMDVSVVYFDPKTKELQWSSSCNPIFVLRNGNLSTLKHQVRASIGSSVRPSSFTGYETSSYMLQPGDEVFLFSDGMSDQFGGATGKKLLLRGFKALLVKLASVPLSQRSDYIRAHFETFRKKEDGKLVSQTDDMILVGFKV